MGGWLGDNSDGGGSRNTNTLTYQYTDTDEEDENESMTIHRQYTSSSTYICMHEHT